MPVVVLAHGLLGGFDEVIFVSIAVIFVGMMGFSWFRSQQLPDDIETMSQDDAINNTSDTTDHFELQ